MGRFESTKLEKIKRTLNMAISGPSGAGKTRSAIMLGNYLGKKKIVIIEVGEKGADEYEDDCDGNVTLVHFPPPYGPKDYIDVMSHVLQEHEPDLVIIDTITPEWKGPGGCLEIVGGFKNTTMGWKKVTPLHDAFITALKTYPVDLICLVRGKEKVGYLKDEGDTESKKHFFGYEPEQRGGIEFEFRLFLDLNKDHKYVAYNARSANLSDSIPQPFDEKAFKSIKEWLDKGVTKEENREFTNNFPVDQDDLDNPETTMEPEESDRPEWKDEVNRLLDAIESAEKFDNVVKLAEMVEEFISETKELPKEAIDALRSTVEEKTIELEVKF